MSEHDFEPIRGLPGDLPKGERLLWQGSPSWTRLACEAFHVRAVALYFGVMLTWRTAAAIGAGTAPLTALEASLSVAPLALLAVGLLAFLGWLNARTTVYTITNKRVVMRFGSALTKAINLPFTIIESGAMKAFADGSGDVAMTLKAPNKLAFLHMWPHVRPWRVASPQPSLRSIKDAPGVARILASAMKAELGVDVAPISAEVQPRAAASSMNRPETAAA
ncbi:photosynthetic complex putative assembly protein PuhB [soil metagenome]